MNFSHKDALNTLIASSLRLLKEQSPDGHVQLVCKSRPRPRNSCLWRVYDFEGFLWRQKGTRCWYPNPEARELLDMGPDEMIQQTGTFKAFERGLIDRFVTKRNGIDDVNGFVWFRRIKVKL